LPCIQTALLRRHCLQSCTRRELRRSLEKKEKAPDATSAEDGVPEPERDKQVLWLARPAHEQDTHTGMYCLFLKRKYPPPTAPQFPPTTNDRVAYTIVGGIQLLALERFLLFKKKKRKICCLDKV
jgi:hypothetical protein